MLGAVWLVPGVGTLDDTARAARMVVELLAQALLVAVKDGLTCDVGRLFEAPAGEVARGQAAGLVHDVDQHGCAVGVESALGLGDVVGAQGVGHLLAAFFEECLVGKLHTGRALAIDDDVLESLAAHHRAQSAAPGVAGGALGQVIKDET